MDAVNPSDDTECEVCFEAKPVSSTLFTCSHSDTFCETCIKKWLTNEHPTCPKCRAKLPLQNYLKTTGQTDVNISDVSITMEYDSSQSNDVPLTNDPLPATSDRWNKVFRCLFPIFIVILTYLFMYWLYIKLEHNE